jgi:hypothetical protein
VVDEEALNRCRRLTDAPDDALLGFVAFDVLAEYPSEVGLVQGCGSTVRPAGFTVALGAAATGFHHATLDIGTIAVSGPSTMVNTPSVRVTDVTDSFPGRGKNG